MPRSTDDVQTALAQTGLDITILISDTPTTTAEEAAAAAGCTLGQIIKSLCFMVRDTPILFLTAGDRMVDTRKVASIYDVGRKRVKMASREKTIEVTGYEPGGVPPLGHASDIPVVIDESLKRFTEVWGAAGSSYAIFPIQLEDLSKVTGGTFQDIASE